MTQAKAINKGSLLSRKNPLVWLTGLTIVYQLVYQILLMRALEQESLDEECSASYGNSGVAMSPHCMEINMFRKWHQQDALVDPGADMTSPYQGEAEILRVALQRTSPTAAAGGDDGALHAQFENKRQALLERHLQQEEQLLTNMKMQKSCQREQHRPCCCSVGATVGWHATSPCGARVPGAGDGLGQLESCLWLW